MTFGGDGNIPPATSTTVVEDVRAFTAVRNPGTVHLTVTPPSASSTSQSVTLAATLAGVPNPQANFIYRFNGAFIASAPAAQSVSTAWASIQIDMRLKIERREKLRHVSRLNRLVFGVALLWLVTSVLVLVISGIGSARSDHNDRKNDRTRKDVYQHLFARIENQAAAPVSFKS